MKETVASSRQRWANLRLCVIGRLLAAPPQAGELASILKELSEQTWEHPTTGQPVRFAVPTIARWYYAARRGGDNPTLTLQRKVHAQAGQHPKVNEALRAIVRQHYAQHPTWSYQLHYDNLIAEAKQRSMLGPFPSYPTVRRWMQDAGLVRQKRKKRTLEGFEPRERRSFEVSHVHGLWHLDFHQGSRKVAMPDGQWHKVVLLCVLDDCSRLCCHLQWFLEETARALVHALGQAILKRGLPRMLLTDNGKPMLAAETTEGLNQLGIVHVTTLPYSPEQNAKQEVFWAQVEGRLMAMLEGEPRLSLEQLNQATTVWAEREYNRKPHRELGMSPLDRFLRGPSVSRPSPSTDALQSAFRMTTQRIQRRSDGTISVEGRRFELPSRFRTLVKPTVRYARWDLSSVELVDPHSGKLLDTLFPLDKQRNAATRRCALQSLVEPARSNDSDEPVPSGIAPALRSMLDDYAASGLPAPYIPLQPKSDDEDPSLNDESSSPDDDCPDDEETF